MRGKLSNGKRVRGGRRPARLNGGNSNERISPPLNQERSRKGESLIKKAFELSVGKSTLATSRGKEGRQNPGFADGKRKKKKRMGPRSPQL